MHDSYDDMGEQTPNTAIVPILVNNDEEDDGETGERESLIHRKKDRGLIASASLKLVMSGGENSSGGWL